MVRWQDLETFKRQCILLQILKTACKGGRFIFGDFIGHNKINDSERHNRPDTPDLCEERVGWENQTCPTNSRVLMESTNQVPWRQVRTVCTRRPHQGNPDVTCPPKLDLFSRFLPWQRQPWLGWSWLLPCLKRTTLVTVTVEPHRPRWWGARTVPPRVPPPPRRHPQRQHARHVLNVQHR